MIRTVNGLFLSILCATALLTQAQALDAVSSCASGPGDPGEGYWKYRLIGGKPCWYPTPRDIIAARIPEVRYKIHHMWSGAFFGANAGYGFTKLDIGPGGSSMPFVAVNPPEVINENGPLAGGQAGYRWRFGKWMTGAEFEFDWANVQGVNAINYSKLQWTNADNLLLGYAIKPEWLAYFGAGYALGRQETENLWTGELSSKQLTGADFELGMQVALTHNVATGIKYQMIDFGRDNVVQAVKWNFDFTFLDTEERAAPRPSSSNPAAH